MKWSCSKKKYAGMLDEGTARQLAAYLGTGGSGASGGEVHDMDLKEVWDGMAERLEETLCGWEAGAARMAERDGKGKVRKESGCEWCELSALCGRIFHEEA